MVMSVPTTAALQFVDDWRFDGIILVGPFFISTKKIIFAFHNRLSMPTKNTSSMITPYQILQSVSSGTIKFGFYSSNGKLFAYGNASQGIDFFTEIGEDAPYTGDLPKVIDPSELEPSNKTEYLSRFLMALVDLERAYRKIDELSPEEDGDY
jgi:hypothetical protein